MRYIIAASLAGSAFAGSATTSGSSGSSGSSGNVANQCVNVCTPILSVSASCGLPVPSNYAVALNPSYWGNSGWFGGWGAGTGNNWGAGTGNTWGATTNSGWANIPSNFPFGWFGFKNKNKRDPQWGPVGANGFGAFNPANTNGWLSSSAVNCVCSSNQYNIDSVGADCLSCLNSVSISNPFLNSFATQCGFSASKKKREAEPAPEAQGTSSGQAKYGGGYAGWSYPSTDNGGAVVSPSGGGSGAAAAAAAGSGGSGGAGAGAGGSGGGQPIFFSGAPKTSFQGVFAVTAVGMFATGVGFLMM